MTENVTYVCFNGIAKTCSITSKSNSAGFGCQMELLESRLHSECATVLKLGKLDFDDVEDDCLLKCLNMELENKQEATTEK